MNGALRQAFPKSVADVSSSSRSSAARLIMALFTAPGPLWASLPAAATRAATEPELFLTAYRLQLFASERRCCRSIERACKSPAARNEASACNRNRNTGYGQTGKKPQTHPAPVSKRCFMDSTVFMPLPFFLPLWQNKVIHNLTKIAIRGSAHYHCPCASLAATSGRDRGHDRDVLNTVYWTLTSSPLKMTLGLQPSWRETTTYR